MWCEIYNAIEFGIGIEVRLRQMSHYSTVKKDLSRLFGKKSKFTVVKFICLQYFSLEWGTIDKR